jgi:hypothetical protein
VRRVAALAAIVLAAAGPIACGGGGVGAGGGRRGGGDQPSQPLLGIQESQTQAILDQFASSPSYFANGEWDPQAYDTTQPDGFWEKEQWPAISEAVAALYYHDTGDQAQADARAQIAIATVNAAIANKQHTNGSYGESGAVGGTFWAQAQGLIALVLHRAGELDGRTLSRWTSSLDSYAGWLHASRNDRWYINGNDNLRITLIMLEAWKLAQLIGSTRADAIHRWYTASESFTMNPCAATHCSPPTGAWGWHQSSPTSGYLSETPPGSNYPVQYRCHGPQPCTGFDPYYTTLQLYDAVNGYVLSGHESWWQRLLVDEWHRVQPLLIDGGDLNASNGSRHNNPTTPFDPSVYAVLDRERIETHDHLWTQQNTDMQAHYQWMEQQPVSRLGPNDWGFISSPASGVLASLF